MRPTSGKTRETLFNWLQFDIAGKTVLDPFSGSGALGIEAISRGAKKTFLIEKNIKVFKNLKEAHNHISKIVRNNDLLMIKGSNATGLNKFSKNIKMRQSNVI